MLRPADISTPAEIALEHERENLRDRKLERFCDATEALSTALAKLIWALVSAVGLAHFLGLI